MANVVKGIVVHFRRWMKFLIAIAIGLGIILAIVFSLYKPMYKVTIKGEFLGYAEDKSALQKKISEYMEKGNNESNIAFVDIEELPKYSICLLKRDHKDDEDKIFQKIISTGVTYYKYYAIILNSEEKYYVSSFQDCENIINQLKEKDSDNVDQISYIVKYDTEKRDFTANETAVAELYVEKKKAVSPTTTIGRVATARNMSFDNPSLGVSFINPIGGIITSRFGASSGVRSGAHTGLDIGASIGTPVAAAASGTITYAGWQGAYGNLITVDHGGGVVTYYGHCNALYRSVGDYVNQGEIIAAVGNTGNSTGPHLHIEIRINGIAYNPIYYFAY